MKKLSIILTLAAIGVAATNVGCSSSPSTGGDGGAGPGDPVTPSADGFLDGSNAAGILGAWYSYGDWYGGTPAVAGWRLLRERAYTEAQCSSITTPVPGAAVHQHRRQDVHLGNGGRGDRHERTRPSGARASASTSTTAAPTTAAPRKLPWDATAHGVTGFSFHIDTPPTGGQMRVEFPTNAVLGTTDINAAYWGGAAANLSPFTKTRRLLVPLDGRRRSDVPHPAHAVRQDEDRVGAVPRRDGHVVADPVQLLHQQPQSLHD